MGIVYNEDKKLLVPDNIEDKCLEIFKEAIKGKNYIVHEFKELSNKFLFIYEIFEIDVLDTKNIFEKFKIIDNITYKKFDDSVIISVEVTKELLSYYQENISELFLHEHNSWEYCFDATKEIEETFSKSKHIPMDIEKINLADLSDSDYGLVLNIHDFLTIEEKNFLKEFVLNNESSKVPVNGKFNSLKENEKIGAERSYIYSEVIARILTDRVKTFLPKFMKIEKNDDSIDYIGHKEWKLEAVNPLFRVIRYKQYQQSDDKYGGRLVPHYDYPFDKNREERSLKSLVIYLTTNETGHTRFLKDDMVQKRKENAIFTKDYNDRQTFPDQDQVITQIKPQECQAIVFEHRLLHDAEEIQKDEEKIILFTDIIYKRLRD